MTPGDFSLICSLKKKKKMRASDRFHVRVIIKNGGRHAENGVYNTISHLGAPRRV